MASPFDSQYNEIRNKIIAYANQYGIPSNIGIWQIWYESTFRSTVCSYAGACGIAQFMPATARRFGVNVNDIDSSLDGWGRYMAWLLRQSYIHGDIRLALAGYNAGERNVQRNTIPRSAQNYVNKIINSASGNVQPTVQQTQVITDPQTIYNAANNLPDAQPQTSGYGKEIFIIAGVGLAALLVFGTVFTSEPEYY